MTIKYAITIDDIIAFNKYVLRKQKYLLMFIFAPLVVTTLLSLILTPHTWQSVIAPLIIFIIIVSFHFNSSYLTKRMIGEKNHNISEQTLTIDESGVHHRTVQTVSDVLWSGIKKIEQNKKYMFIFIEKNEAYIIPKRFFTSLTDNKAFYETSIELWKKFN